MRWSGRRSLVPASQLISEENSLSPFNFETLVVELTQSCNNNCSHCYNYWHTSTPPPRRSPELTGGQFCDLVRKVMHDTPLKQIALSGGEPFLRPDLPSIVSDLMAMDLEVVVITNGSLLSESRLRQFPHGCTFEVTLFGADASLHDSHAGREVFTKLINNLANIETHNHGFALAFVITSRNAHDVARTIKLGVALGAQAVLLNRINICKRVYTHDQRLIPNVAQLNSALDQAEGLSNEYGIPIAISVPIPACLVDINKYENLHFGWCPRGGNQAYYTLGCDGYLRPCNHSSLILGDLKRESFGQIVSKNKSKAFWSHIPKECRECENPLRTKCLGGCPAAAHECYGTAERLDPFIKLAMS